MLVYFCVGSLDIRSNFYRFRFQSVCDGAASRLAAKINGLGCANVHSITHAILEGSWSVSFLASLGKAAATAIVEAAKLRAPIEKMIRSSLIFLNQLT